MSQESRRPSFPLDSEKARRLYYTTTTAEAYGPLKDLAEGKGENFIDVHGIGQRTGKYFKYQKKRAPLLDRSSVYYYTDYVVLPLDDAPVTKALAKENKLRSSPGFSSASGAKFDDTTTHKAAYRGCSRGEFLRAKQKSSKPKAGRSSTLPGGDMLEKRSVTHDVFGLPVRWASEPAKPPRPNLFVGMRSHPPTTSYAAQFRSTSRPSRPASAGSLGSSPVARVGTPAPPRRCHSAPAHGRAGDSDRLRWQASQAVLLDEEVLKMRRVPYMSPGQ